MAPPPPSSGVTAQAYGTMRAVEDAHWWFDAMERITARLLAVPGGRPPRAVLDAGCGTGRSLRFLAARFPAAAITGLDFSPVALQHCGERGFHRLVGGSVNALPFAPDTFDLVTSFDVLTAESVDEPAALREQARVLRPGGRLLVRVAAYDFLRSRHDAEWNIGRRYTRSGLRAKLIQAGFDVKLVSHANALLLPVALAKRWAERVFPPENDGSDLRIGAGTGRTAAILRAILASEAPWVARGRLPFGLSVVALADKPAAPGLYGRFQDHWSAAQ